MRFDDQDLGSAWVVDPLTRRSERLEGAHPEYMRGLTLYQHRMCTLLAAERLDGAKDVESLAHAKTALFEEARTVMRRNRKESRAIASVARFAGLAPVPEAAEGETTDDDPAVERDDDFEPLPLATEIVRRDGSRGART